MILPQYTSIPPSNNQKSTPIIRQILDCYSSPHLLGKFRFQPAHNYDIIHVVLIHPHLKQQWIIELHFPEDYPKVKVNVTFYISNDFSKASTIYDPDSQNIGLKDIILDIYNHIEKKYSLQLHQEYFQLRASKDSLTKITKSNESLQINEEISESDSEQKQVSNIEKSLKKKLGRKNVSMTGCADRQLTETKNLNRHFRSKLREVHRDLVKNEQNNEDAMFIEKVFQPNRVGFEDIRKSLKNTWFNKGVKEQMMTGRFLHKVLRGMMGIKSKKLMIKYYHVMVSAVEEPQSFIKWKYE